MENKSHAFLAGLFAIFLGCASLGALYWFGGKREATRDYLVISRQSVSGLNLQAQVRYRGIKVGKVTAIGLEKATSGTVRHIEIRIRVDESVPVTTATRAKLGFQGVTGIAHVLLDDGQRTGHPVVEDGTLHRIEMLPSIIDELNDAGPMILKQARETMVSLNQLLSEQNRASVAATLAHLERSSGQLAPALENLNATLGQVRQLLNDDNMKRLSAVAAEAGPMVAETRLLVARLNAVAGKLDGVIGDVSAGGSSALVPRLNELATDVSATSRQLNRVLTIIEESPQSMLFGAPPVPPGPGEPGFQPPIGQ